MLFFATSPGAVKFSKKHAIIQKKHKALEEILKPFLDVNTSVSRKLERLMGKTQVNLLNSV